MFDMFLPILSMMECFKINDGRFKQISSLEMHKWLIFEDEKLLNFVGPGPLIVSHV